MFDARLHPHSLSDSDLETLLGFGVRRALLVAEASSNIDGVEQRWDEVLTQQARLSGLGLDAVVALSVPCRFGDKRGVTALLRALPRALGQPHVAALGPLSLTSATPAEAQLVLDQLQLAHELARPVLISASPHKHEALVAKSLALVARTELLADQVLIDGLRLKTVRSALARGHLAGLTLHPEVLDVDLAERMIHSLGPERLVLGSGAGDGPSDLLALPRLVSRLKQARLSGGVVTRVSERNVLRWLRLR